MATSDETTGGPANAADAAAADDIEALEARLAHLEVELKAKRRLVADLSTNVRALEGLSGNQRPGNSGGFAKGLLIGIGLALMLSGLASTFMR